MSAPGLKAAIVRVPCHVAEVPKADIQHMTSAAVEQGSWRARSLEFSRCSCAPLINRYSLKSLRHPVDLLLLSPLGERLSEGVIQESVVGCTPSPNLSPEGERNMTPLALLLPRG